jgi:hypothetical protein
MDAGVDAGMDAGTDAGADRGVDASGDMDTSILDTCAAGVEPTGPLGFLVIQDLRSEDDGLRIRFVLEPGDGHAVGETFPYELIRFALASADASFCVDQDTDLDYEWGHHNWNETGKARHDNVEYTFRNVLDMMGGGGWDDSIEARSPPGGDLLWGPLTLRDAGCGSVPPGNPNTCLWRDRNDQ